MADISAKLVKEPVVAWGADFVGCPGPRLVLEARPYGFRAALGIGQFDMNGYIRKGVAVSVADAHFKRNSGSSGEPPLGQTEPYRFALRGVFMGEPQNHLTPKSLMLLRKSKSEPAIRRVGGESKYAAITVGVGDEQRCAVLGFGQ